MRLAGAEDLRSVLLFLNHDIAGSMSSSIAVYKSRMQFTKVVRYLYRENKQKPDVRTDGVMCPKGRRIAHPGETGGLSRDGLDWVIILEDWGHEGSGCSRPPRIESRYGVLLAQLRKSKMRIGCLRILSKRRRTRPDVRISRSTM